MGKLQDMGPNSLAVVLKGMASLGHRPSPAWQEAYFSALQRGLFASRPGGDVPCLDVRMHTQAAAITSSSTLTGLTQGSSASAAAASAATAAASAATAGVSADVANASSTGHNSIMSCASNGSTSEAAAAAASWVPHALPATGASGLSVASLNSLVYALASLDMHPPASTMLVLLDAVRRSRS